MNVVWQTEAHQLEEAEWTGIESGLWGPTAQVLNPSLLCDLRQATAPLWASESSAVQRDSQQTYLLELL